MARNGNARTHGDYTSYLTDHIPAWLSRLGSVAEATDHTHGQQKITPEDGSTSQTQDKLFTSAALHLKWRELQGPSAMKSVIQATQATKSNKGSHPSTKRINSDTSSQYSGVNHYRARNAISVVYDSSTQIQLEALVDEINTARRLVRTANEQIQKQAATSRLSHVLKPDDAIEVDSTDGLYANDRRDSLDREFMMAQIRRQRQRRASPPSTTDSASSRGSVRPSTTETQRTEKLATMEECLQHAQDTCTIAAYQMLRDGQCFWEMKAISDQLSEVWMAVREDGATASSWNEQASHDYSESNSLPYTRPSPPFDEYKLHQWRVQIVPGMADAQSDESCSF